VPGGVVQEVRQHLREPLGVGDHGELRGLHGDLDPSRPARGPGLGGGVLEQAAEVDLGPHQRDLSGLQARQVQQLGDQPTEPAGLRQRGAERLGVRAG
jgi:hypothetical protein